MRKVVAGELANTNEFEGKAARASYASHELPCIGRGQSAAAEPPAMQKRVRGELTQNASSGNGLEDRNEALREKPALQQGCERRGRHCIDHWGVASKTVDAASAQMVFFATDDGFCVEAELGGPMELCVGTPGFGAQVIVGVDDTIDKHCPSGSFSQVGV